ncbi:hypothetical protein PHYPSEUDO_013480 [Phytophthora pseudosyringae]|uniref:RxLR effector protein n=1 Tax=Phytophthora pseudosyringae TaxID=221518 RepID=A0A8T1WFP2_9STRA|nr:hypothetical protein PHYPSEUDO_013480 [Phytophthora pseudosyringae]
MRLNAILLATAVALLASSDDLVAANTKTGLYAGISNVQDGEVLDKMRVPLGGSKSPDLKQRNTDQEERAAVHLPAILRNGPIHGLFKRIGKFLMKLKATTKWGSRRLRIDGP